MTKDNRNQLINLVNVLKEMKFDTLLMSNIKRAQAFLLKSVDVCIACAEEMIEHPETPDENASNVITSLRSFNEILANIRYGIRDLYPADVVASPNWNSFVVNPIMVH